MKMSRILVEPYLRTAKTVNPEGGCLIFQVGDAYSENENLGPHLFVETEDEILDCLTEEEFEEVVQHTRAFFAQARLVKQ